MELASYWTGKKKKKKKKEKKKKEEKEKRRRKRRERCNPEQNFIFEKSAEIVKERI